MRRQAGQNRPGAPFQQNSRSSAEQSGRLRTGGSWVQFLPGAPFFPRRSPMQRQRAQTSTSAGASPAAGTTLAPVAQRRGSGLKPRSVSVRIRPGAFLSQCPVSPIEEAPNSKLGQCECNSRRGHHWNVNRTSEPGFRAKEIVRLWRMGSMPSAFRHIQKQALPASRSVKQHERLIPVES